MNQDAARRAAEEIIGTCGCELLAGFEWSKTSVHRAECELERAARIIATAIAHARAEERAAAEKYYDQMARDFVKRELADLRTQLTDHEARAERERWEQGVARAEGLLRKFWDGESSDAVLVADAAAVLVKLLRRAPTGGRDE